MPTHCQVMCGHIIVNTKWKSITNFGKLKLCISTLTNLRQMVTTYNLQFQLMLVKFQSIFFSFPDSYHNAKIYFYVAVKLFFVLYCCQHVLSISNQVKKAALWNNSASRDDNSKVILIKVSDNSSKRSCIIKISSTLFCLFYL